jgi:hypothetical protein
MGSGQHLDRLGQRAVAGERAVVVAVGADQTRGALMSCCVSRRRVRVGLEISQELTVDGIRDPPLQTPQASRRVLPWRCLRAR